jgi:hypothetical protein
MGVGSHNCRAFWSATTAASTAVPIGEVVDFSGPGGQAAVIDVTHLLSTAKEKVMGVADEGQLTMGLNFEATNAGQVALRTDRGTRSKKKCSIKFPTSGGATSQAVFDGYCLGFTVSGAVDSKQSANVVIEIAGQVTWTTG